MSFDIGTIIDIDSLTEGEDFYFSITRYKFEDLCKYLFNKIIPLIEEVLGYSSLTRNQIDEIILTGGSTRIPNIQEIIKAFFNTKQLNKANNLEEVYIYDAALLAGMFNNDKDKSPETLFLLDEENNKKEIKQMKSKSENDKKLLEEIEKLKKEKIMI